MLEPSQKLENTIKIINSAFNFAGVKYWLCFGGLWGLIRNNGIIPDDDIDLCVLYGEDHNRIAKAFSGTPGRYSMTKVMLNDTDKNRAVYCAFNSEAGYPHICLSFWYKHNDIRYYCHDQHREVVGIGTPSSGYYFRGVPAYAVEGDVFRMVEWPGIQQATKIRVPRFPGVILDNMYPDWGYMKQRYEIKKNDVNQEKMASYHKGGAISPYAIHVSSMGEFLNEKYVQKELLESKRKWDMRLNNK